MDRRDVVLFSPWIGEFGWELIWQARCRKISRGYRHAFVLSNECNYYLYSDFSSLIPYPYFEAVSNRNGWKGVEDGVSSVEYARSLQVCLGSDLVTPEDEFAGFSFDYRISGREEFISYGSAFSEEYICVHARNRTECSERNWGNEYWNELVNAVLSMGHKVVAIGGASSFCPDGAINAVGLDVKRTISILKGAKLVLGESSGPMHLAMLSNKPVLVWWTGRSDNINKSRYEKYWNFHGSRVIALGEQGHFIAPAEIVEKIGDIL